MYYNSNPFQKLDNITTRMKFLRLNYWRIYERCAQKREKFIKNKLNLLFCSMVKTYTIFENMPY